MNCYICENKLEKDKGCHALFRESGAEDEVWTCENENCLKIINELHDALVDLKHIKEILEEQTGTKWDICPCGNHPKQSIVLPS